MTKINQLRMLCGLSFCLILIGGCSIYYTYDTFPTLIPYYGGGEAFTLNHHNNFTEIYMWDFPYPISVEIETDASIQSFSVRLKIILGHTQKSLRELSLLLPLNQMELFILK